MPQAVYILFGAAFTVLTAIACGRLVLWKLDVKLYREEQWLFCFVSGSALLSMFVFLLCAAGVLTKGMLLALGALLILLARSAKLSDADPLPVLPQTWKWLFVTGYSAFGVLYFTNAMAPELSPDGTTYHLGLVGRYYREHGFHSIATNMYAHLTQGAEMLFLMAYAFGRNSAAALVHASFLFTLPLLMLSYARRFGFADMGVVAALLVFLSPVVGVDGASAYNDAAAACVLFAMFYAVRLRAWALAGWLSGFAFAVKYTAGLAIPYGAIAARRKFWIVLLVASPMVAPWLMKNLTFTGNPVAPLFNSVFPNNYVHIDFERIYRNDMRHFGDVKDREIPFEVTLRGARLGGLTGPVFLLAPIALLALRYHEGRRILIPAVIFTLPFLGNIGTRFLIPGLPFWSLAMALALRNTPALAAAVVILHGLASWPSMIPKYSDTSAWRLEKIRWREALRIIPEEKFLTEHSPGYVTARMIEDKVPAGEKVFAFDSRAAEAYTKREIVVSFQSALGRRLADMLYTPIFEDLQPVWPQEFRFPPQRVRKLRAVLTETGADKWSVSEFRIFSGQTELPRDPRWRLKARPNSWNVQDAFDSSPVTRWHTHEAMEPGQFIEVDLGGERVVDRVLLDMSRDQYQVRLKLEGAGDDGRWRTLVAKAADGPVHRYANLRRAVWDEFDHAGIHYLLISDDDIEAKDFIEKMNVWGMEQIDKKGKMRLFKCDCS